MAIHRCRPRRWPAAGLITRRAGIAIGLTVALGIAAQAWRSPVPANARPGGITGYSGNPGTNRGATCTSCHAGGRAPDVVIEGPASVAVGTTHTYTLTISGGQRTAGGLDVSATNGALDILDAAKDTQRLDEEITHTEPKRGDRGGRIAFAFQWTAPGNPGRSRLYGAGNSVNLNGNSVGDAPDTATLIIDVIPAVTPTPFPVVAGPYAVAVADLANPHGLSTLEGSGLLIGEGGTVGTTWKPGQRAPGAGDGRVAHISLAPGGPLTPVVERMTNVVDPAGGVVGGNHAIRVPLGTGQGGTSLVTLVAQGGGPGHARPAEAAKILMVDAGGTVSVLADPLAYEQANNPDGAPGDAGIESNPWRLVAGKAGTVYVVDSGANDILALDLTTRVLSTWAVFPVMAQGRQVVPTGLALASEDAAVAYVSLLGETAGTAEIRRLEDVNRDGDMRDPGESSVLVDSARLVTDLALGPSGHLYYTQIADGTLWRVDAACLSGGGACGASERAMVADRLPGASGLAFTDAGDGLVSVTNRPNPAGMSVHTDQIVRIPRAMLLPPATPTVAPTQTPTSEPPTATASATAVAPGLTATSTATATRSSPTPMQPTVAPSATARPSPPPGGALYLPWAAGPQDGVLSTG